MSKIVIFDTETTGLDEEDRIIQVGAIILDLDDKEHIEHYDELCSTNEVPIKIEAMSVHGIREEAIKDKPLYKDTKFKKALDKHNKEENYLVAHNITYDIKMIKKEGFENNYKLIDTLQCAKHLYKQNESINDYKLPNYKLQTFRYILLSLESETKEAEKYGVEIKAHDAIGDVIVLKLFLRELYIKTSKKYKIKDTVGILDKLAELTKELADIEIMPFGKHSGKKLKDIDIGYIKWLYEEQEKNKNTDNTKLDKDLHNSLKKIIEAKNTNQPNSEWITF